jgi:hypothetical protein
MFRIRWDMLLELSRDEGGVKGYLCLSSSKWLLSSRLEAISETTASVEHYRKFSIIIKSDSA